MFDKISQKILGQVITICVPWSSGWWLEFWYWVWNKSCYEENIHVACVHDSQRRLVAASDDKYFILILWLQVIKLIY